MLKITSYFTGYSLLLVAEVSWTGSNVSIPMCCKYGSASQLTKHTGRNSLTTFCLGFSSKILFYSYLYTIYIDII